MQQVDHVEATARDTDMFSRQLTRFAPLLFVAFFGVLFAPTYLAAPADLRIFGAASLKDAIDDANGRFRRVTGHTVVASYGGSDSIAKQIENGTLADIFIPADIDWMDYLASSRLIRPETRFNFLGNKLVLIAPAGRATTLAISPNFPLAQALGNGRLAIANPVSVPAGKYGKAALEALGVWASVEGRLAPARDVRAALELVHRGEAPLGIVYQTDAVVDQGVDIVGTFPASLHPSIIYPLAVTAASTNPTAESYITFLQSPAVAAAFGQQGFAVLR
jgi:molybdate transport system substrate-binding protein